MITLDQLKKIMPALKAPESWLGCLNNTMAEFGIDTPYRMSAFLATVAHESGQLSTLSENLNYSSDRLLAVFPKYFPTKAIADAYTHKPEKIANRIYANRMGNGDEASGDGWRHRGAGPTQVTGKNNQQMCADYFKMSLDAVGDYMRTPEGGCRSAGLFWKNNNLNKWADAGDFDGVSDVVNMGHKTAKEGDSIGWEDRNTTYHRALLTF